MATDKLPNVQRGANGPNLDVTDAMVRRVGKEYERLLDTGLSAGEALKQLKTGYAEPNGKWIQAGWLDKHGEGAKDAVKRLVEWLEERDLPNPYATPAKKLPGKQGKPAAAAAGGAHPGGVTRHAREQPKKEKTKEKKNPRAGEHWIEVPSRKVNPYAQHRRKILLDRDGTIIGGDVPKVLMGQDISDPHSWNALTDPFESTAWKKQQEKEKRRAGKKRKKGTHTVHVKKPGLKKSLEDDPFARLAEIKAKLVRLRNALRR